MSQTSRNSHRRPQAHRIVQITMMLALDRRICMKDLCERFQVHRRTIARDMRAIRDAGVHVVYFPAEDQYRLVDVELE